MLVYAHREDVEDSVRYRAWLEDVGSEWITTDRDYARFTGLRWRRPLD